MFKFKQSLLITLALITSCVTSLTFAQASAKAYDGIGRAATTSEIRAWDIDVRPDFRGLPKGAGSVAKGQEIWEAKCASCHGYFGESNQFFNPIIGGVVAQDLKSGRVASLRDPGYPQRTTMMKLSSLSTLWDYINRAMPWNNPKTLTTDEVYAVTAYILNLSAVVPDEFVLTDSNIGQVQQILPNRLGKTTAHALWPDSSSLAVQTKPDVTNTRCFKDCHQAKTGTITPTSTIPDYARDAHGNLAEQNRLVGPQRGINTARVASAATTSSTIIAKPNNQLQMPSAPVSELLNKYSCTACHGMDTKMVGPAFRDITAKYASQADALAYLTSKIRLGSVGVWGSIPMPAQAITEGEAVNIAAWLAGQALTPAKTSQSVGQSTIALGK
jgi:S-disulfanyl-L-cysteine oxidoreductase SoxD